MKWALYISFLISFLGKFRQDMYICKYVFTFFLLYFSMGFPLRATSLEVWSVMIDYIRPVLIKNNIRGI